MQSLSCILLLVQRGENVHGGLNKALLLARHLGARLELLICETQCHPAHAMARDGPGSTIDDSCLAEGRLYLQALRQTIVDPGVDIGSEAVCAASLADGVIEKLRRTPAQLVVRALRPSVAVGPSDWRLFYRCHVPLLLTSGRPWRASPRFAAFVGTREPALAPQSSEGLELPQILARGCDARLDYLSEAPTSEGASVGGVPTSLMNRREYDLISLSLPHAPPGASGALALRQLQQLGDDVLLVH